VICGDPNPQGPGYREIPVSWALEGEHDGEEQRVAKGSWIDIPLLDLGNRRMADCLRGDDLADADRGIHAGPRRSPACSLNQKFPPLGIPIPVKNNML